MNETLRFTAKGTNRICMYIYSAVTGAAASFGFFMFTAWLSMVAFNKVAEDPRFYSFSIVSMLICFLIFVVLTILWIVQLLKQKNKLRSAGISALFALAGLGIGFVAFLFLSSVAIMS